ncbi:MAG: hypothetical protein PHN84_10895 [Desulfuromonadaceae bacterium]|nr:hypothetical protein [Desulfuromonadaceae bacterium]MDD2856732.1 hypothetical protein [Desulfuromonadaceae bacterium]
MSTKSVTVTFDIKDDGNVEATIHPVSGYATTDAIFNALIAISHGIFKAEDHAYTMSRRLA